jgi:hypothetical protein
MLIGFSDGSPSQYQRIHELLREHYPLQRDESDFQTSPAHEQALQDGQNPAHYEKWKQYLKNVKAKRKGVLWVSSASFTMVLPALEGAFTLRREKIGRVVYRRTFRVFLSLIGNFYAMFGQDEVLVEAGENAGANNTAVAFDPVLYPTPLDIYEKWFFLFQDAMAEAYPGYEFVPYRTLRYRLKDISTGLQGAEGRAQSLFQALFSAEDINPCRIQIDLTKHPFEQGEFE